MRKIVLFCFLSTLQLWALAQSTAATATNVVCEDYANNPPTWVNYCLVAPGGAETASSCATNLTDIYWIRFTIPSTAKTCSVKLSVQPTGFDAVVDLYTNSGTFLQCSNTAGSGSQETLRSNPNSPNFVVLTPGTTYLARISSTTDVTSACFNVGVEFYVAGELRPTYAPNPQFDDATAGYKVSDAILRVFNGAADAQVQLTEWRITDASNPSDPGCTFIINGTLNSLSLRDLPCICYGRTYNVVAQLRIDGHFTGACYVRQINMEPEPLTFVTNPPSCTSQALNGSITCLYLGNAAQVQWELATSTGTITAPLSATIGNILYLQNVPCLRYNRVYNVRVRAGWCGTWGSWSSPYCLITQPIPFTQLLSTQCGANVGRYSVFRCPAVPGASQYIWQFAEINPGDIQNPIAPASVICSIGEFTGAGAFIQIGKTYRVGVKPVLPSSTTACSNVFSACNSYQQGDFGIFCQITVTGNLMTTYPTDQESIFTAPSRDDNGRLVWITSPSSHNKNISINFTGKEAFGNGIVRIYNMAGQLILQENLTDISSDALYQVQLPESLPANMYVVNVQTESGSWSDKFVIQQ